MSHRPVSVVRGSLETVAVYVHDDRLEVGKISPFGVEQLRRVMLRDATRLIVWRTTRRIEQVVGIVLAVVALLGIAVAIVASDPTAQALAGLLSGVVLLLALYLLWVGRPNAETRLRLEGRRGSVEARLRGSARKREKIVRDLVERIHARQDRHVPAAQRATSASPSSGRDPTRPS